MEKKKLFVGNLDFKINKEQVVELFSRYGKVENIRMQNKKGYAFMASSIRAAISGSNRHSLL